jgi:hypothetical protein
MSAFVVDPTHIDVILSTAIRGPNGVAPYPGWWTPPYTDELLPGTSGPLRAEDADLAGEVLLAECIASVSFRYPDSGPGALPGPIPTPNPPDYEWAGYAQGLTAIEACKAIDCYEYQSCEHPGWGESGSRSFCERLRHILVGAMAGYEDAPWGWTAELARQRGLTVHLLHRPRPRSA